MKRLFTALTLSSLLMTLPAQEVRATPDSMSVHKSTVRETIENSALHFRHGPTNVDGICPPTKDSLSIYNFSSYINVTNHGGKYDSGASFSYDYTRRCQVSPITSILIRDNFGVSELPSSLYGRFELMYKELGNSNCWEIARVSAYGQSEWSNKVCYTAPAIQPTSITGIYMYLDANGQLDGDVYINWVKGSDSTGLHWTACPPSDTYQPANPSWSYDQTSYSSSGQTVFTGHTSIGPRCKLVYAKNSNGILSTPIRVEYTFEKRMAQPYSSSPGYVAPYSSKTGFGSSGNYSSHSASSSKDCVGICYGVPSQVNGRPRNTYVSGYIRKDGTYVRPYTRSK